MDTNSHECFLSPRATFGVPAASELREGVRRLDAAFFQTANATADQQPQEETQCSIWLNCLDIFDALRVKDVYAPKRKQGESAH